MLALRSRQRSKAAGLFIFQPSIKLGDGGRFGGE
jgi:hypothetical protein